MKLMKCPLIWILFFLIILWPSTAFAINNQIPSWIQDNASWWSQGKISDQEFISTIQYLIDNDILHVEQESDEIDNLKNQNEQMQKSMDDLTKKYDSLLEKYNDEVATSKTVLEMYFDLSDESINYEKEVNAWIEQEQSKPITTIRDQTIHWHVTDSKGNMYNWAYLVADYEVYVTADRYDDELYFETDDGEVFPVLDHTVYVGTSFEDVIDEVYNNSIDDQDFMYEVWHITSQLTTYSYDIGEYPRWAVETLSRGGGDCEDTTILILEMINSSQHTKDWELGMLYFDSDNPENPDTINHVVPVITIEDETWIIESTAKSDDGMDQWNYVSVDGWIIDV